ncbi:hypothetical protein SRHO_G00180140 [Serrasalmus rhombeus]
MRVLFLSLTLLTFILCRRQLNVYSTAQVNLCINLLFSKVLFWLPDSFINHIRTNRVVCAVLAGFHYFFFHSYYMWLFIDAVLLFISAKNLTKIRSRQKEMLGWKSLTVIGYVIPLIVGSASVAVMFNEHFRKNENEMLSFVCLILDSQQGTFIFLTHCVLNKEVRQQYRKWFCTCLYLCKKPTTVNDTQTTERSVSSA